MRKSILVLFLFAFLIPQVFLSQSHADTECVIVSGATQADMPFQVLTNETSRTAQATYEAFVIFASGLPDSCDDNCCYLTDGLVFEVCDDGTTYFQMGTFIYNGYWDVVCGLDSDADSYPDDYDNCPNDTNTDQRDCDEDGTGDVCDIIKEPANDFVELFMKGMKREIQK